MVVLSYFSLVWRRAYVGLVLAVFSLQRRTDNIENPLSKKAAQGIILVLIDINADTDTYYVICYCC